MTQLSSERAGDPKKDRLLPKHERRISYYGRASSTFGSDVLNYLKEHIQEGRILDSGTSSGAVATELAIILGDQVSVVGLDIHTRAIELAKQQETQEKSVAGENAPEQPKTVEGRAALAKRLNWVQGDSYFPPFPNDSFEAVFMMNNIYHIIQSKDISQHELKIVLKNQLAILKPGGYLCISGVNTIDEENGLTQKSIYPYIIFQLDENKQPHVVFQSIDGNLNKEDLDKGWLQPAETIEILKSAMNELSSSQ